MARTSIKGGDRAVVPIEGATRGVRLALMAAAFLTITLGACASSPGPSRAPSGTGQVGGNGNVPTYTP